MKLPSAEGIMFAILAKIIAAITLLGGAAMFVGGFAIASDAFGPHAEVMARYWPGKTSGEMIDKGLMGVVFAVALGTLGEIGASLRKLTK